MNNTMNNTMSPTSPTRRRTRRRTGIIATVVTAAGLTIASCGGSAGTAPATTGAGSTLVADPASGGQVLPVEANPIVNDASARSLTIDSVLVENNVDDSGAAVDDHLEISLSNTGTTDLGGVEVFYTFTDPTDGISESYYAKLPDSFTIPAGGTRIAHFDNTGAPDHFPVNEFSLYTTSLNAQEVTVEVSATGAAVQTADVMKDAGGAETAD